MAEIFMTPEMCRKFRDTCGKHQEVVRGLLEEAITHSQELAEAKTEMAEKHMEKLFSMMGIKCGTNEKDIRNLHKKINKLKDKITYACIFGIIAIITPFVIVKTDIGKLQKELSIHTDPRTHDELKISFNNHKVRMKQDIDKFNYHVARSDELIKKYNTADDKTTERDAAMDERLHVIENTINKYKHSH